MDIKGIMKKIFFTAALFLLFQPYNSFAVEKPVARILAALYDSHVEPTPRASNIHNFLEMPANHLGYDINYYDIHSPLPALGDDVAGVVIWFNPGTKVPDIHAYLNWLKNITRQGKKLIIMGDPGIQKAYLKDHNIIQAWNAILGYIGVQDDAGWNQFTYNAEITYIDKSMVGFERKLKPPFPEIPGFHILPGSKSVSHLRMHISDSTDNNANFDMVITSPNGGFAAQGYIFLEEIALKKKIKEHSAGKETKIVEDDEFEWIINPFLFLSRSLNIKTVPIPDTTTLDGRRIFYAHIDGDGWNNISEIERYNKTSTLSADVIYREILKNYPDFAFSVGLISEDVDPDCFAVPDSEIVARRIFALPNVEPSSHTYSHPLYWHFFEDYTPEKEKPYLKYYPLKPAERFSAVSLLKNKVLYNNDRWPEIHVDSSLGNAHEASKNEKETDQLLPYKKIKSEDEILKEYGYMPRSYACTPFDLKQEIYTSVATVKRLSPPDKKIILLQWPGDTSPFEAAIAMTRKAGLLNINGGDSRFDGEYPSYSFVAPIGIKIGKERQIFSSNSNEETYTDEWTDRFYGYKYLQATVENTNKPIRVSPFNLYFHMFSGQKEAGVSAIKDNLDYARTQDLIPITASDYAAIANGFYTTEIIPEGEHAWHIKNRGNLETLRFDDATDLSIDFNASRGVMGQHVFNDSLYVALDPAAEDIYMVVHKGRNASGKMYLVQSNWKIKNLHRNGGDVEFDADGYGKGNMVWKGDAGAEYRVTSRDRKGKSLQTRVHAGNNGLISFSLKNKATEEPLEITIRRI